MKGAAWIDAHNSGLHIVRQACISPIFGRAGARGGHFPAGRKPLRLPGAEISV